MNILIIIGFVLAGGIIAVDHLIYELSQWLAVALYSISVIFFIIGMVNKKQKSKVRKTTKSVLSKTDQGSSLPASASAAGSG